MAQQGAQRGPMATFDALLQAYLDYLALADDAARAAFLRERVGFKASPGETFKDGPGGLGVFVRLFDAVLHIATTGMVGRLYGANEDRRRGSEREGKRREGGRRREEKEEKEEKGEKERKREREGERVILSETPGI